jgi:hypothetical protein
MEADFSLWRVSRAYPPTNTSSGRGDARCPPSRRGGVALVPAGHEEHLRRLRSVVPALYLAVSLELDRPSHLGAGLLRGADRARRRLEELLGVAGMPPILTSEMYSLIAC